MLYLTFDSSGTGGTPLSIWRSDMLLKSNSSLIWQQCVFFLLGLCCCVLQISSDLIVVVSKSDLTLNK